MATRIAPRTGSPGCGAPSTNPGGNHEQKSCCHHTMSQINKHSHTKAAYKATKFPLPSEDPMNIASSDEST
eukprot:5746798-Ditylum_brightwellii.AAC.1